MHHSISVILQQPDICNKNVIAAEKTRRVLKVIDHPNFSRAGSLGELVYDFALLRVSIIAVSGLIVLGKMCIGKISISDFYPRLKII